MSNVHPLGLLGVALAAGLTAGAAAQVQAHRSTEPVRRHDGEKVVRVEINRPRDLQIALALTDDVWTESIRPGRPLDIRVNHEQFKALQSSGVRFSIMIDDLQAAIDAESAEVRRRANGDDPAWYENYHDYTEVKAYTQALAAAYPTLASYSVIGQSLQNREIFALRVTGPGSTANRPASLWWGGQHAREWINIPVPMYCAEQLLTQYATNPAIRFLVDNVEFIFVPTMNPDGYEYTWTTERMWRKNRRDNPTSSCDGVDLNRNWGHQWGGQGSSGQPCQETYRGPSAFSEPETQVMRDFIIANPRIRTTMDFHSYGQLVMSPWGYTSALPTPAATAQLFQGLDNQMAAAILGVHGQVYQAGPVYSTIYPASGVSVDWAFGARGIWGFTIEVRDTGATGFLLPPSEILPTAEENFQAFLVLARAVAPCYVNCDGSTTAPVLNVNDFLCFQNKFAAGDSSANCDGSTTAPILNVNDFLCFQNKYAEGCP